MPLVELPPSTPEKLSSGALGSPVPLAISDEKNSPDSPWDGDLAIMNQIDEIDDQPMLLDTGLAIPVKLAKEDDERERGPLDVFDDLEEMEELDVALHQSPEKQIPEPVVGQRTGRFKPTNTRMKPPLPSILKKKGKPKPKRKLHSQSPPR